MPGLTMIPITRITPWKERRKKQKSTITSCHATAPGSILDFIQHNKKEQNPSIWDNTNSWIRQIKRQIQKKKKQYKMYINKFVHLSLGVELTKTFFTNASARICFLRAKVRRSHVQHGLARGFSQLIPINYSKVLSLHFNCHI